MYLGIQASVHQCAICTFGRSMRIRDHGTDSGFDMLWTNATSCYIDLPICLFSQISAAISTFCHTQKFRLRTPCGSGFSCCLPTETKHQKTGAVEPGSRARPRWEDSPDLFGEPKLIPNLTRRPRIIMNLHESSLIICIGSQCLSLVGAWPCDLQDRFPVMGTGHVLIFRVMDSGQMWFPQGLFLLSFPALAVTPILWGNWMLWFNDVHSMSPSSKML